MPLNFKCDHIPKILSFCILFFCSSIQSEQLTLVYPDVKAPYDKIFQQINQGIQQEFNGDITFIPLSKDYNIEKTVQAIKTQKVIALGKRGMNVAKRIYKNQDVVVGALPIKPNGISGVSLMAAPNMLFDSLNILAPEITQVTVLYTPSSAWIMGSASNQAKLHGLTLNSIEVKDLRTAVKTYNALFENDQLKNTAIWLPLDPITAHEKIIIPVILEKAWSNKVVVFSSKPTHAKRGALFSAIPNNLELGKQLARLVNKIDHKSVPSIVKALDNANLAVNLRTAAHLGYNYNANKRAHFALTFPQ